MIRIFYGTPGAGKSYDMLRDLLEELLWGQRLIVTNLSVDIGKLNAYCAKHYPDVDIGDINQRIRIITEDETKHFYAYRTIAQPPLDVPSREASLAGRHVNYDGARAVAYYIDEAHIAFDAREWANTGPELTYYASQHRKIDGYGDECIFATQHPDMLESRLRKLAQEFWSHCNNALEKIWTIFRKPSFFSVEVHRKPPTGPNSPKPQATYRFKLDPALASCYDTSAGIGIKGRNRPEVRRRGGVTLLWLIIPALVVVVCIKFAPDLAVGYFNKVVGKAQEPADSGQPNSVLVPPSPNGRAPGEVGMPQSVAPGPAPVPVSVKSYAIHRREVLVTLTDGRTLTREDGIVRITRDTVVLRDGTKYRINRGRKATEVAVAGPAQPAGD